MSIRGIDTQMMITRSSDLVRDVSATQNRPEVNQASLAAHEKFVAAQDQSRVQATLESEMEQIRPDEEGESGNEYEGSGRKGHRNEKENEEDKADTGLKVGQSDHVIDIMV